MRQRLFRYLIYALVLPLISVIGPVNNSAFAAETSQTITVKYPNGSAYSGALVQIRYYISGADAEVAKSVQTTNASGQVTISYPSIAAYAQMMISPAAGDVSNAVTAIDLLTSSASAITNVTLKAANVVVAIDRPDGTAAGLGTCINYPKANYNRWLTTQYRTVRSGSFGIYTPTDLYSTRDYFIEVNPCNEADSNYFGIKYGLRRAANGTISIYTDGTFASTMSQSGGVFHLLLAESPISGLLKNSDGTTHTPAANANIYISAMPIKSNGDADYFRGGAGGPVASDGKYALDGAKALEAGKYQLRVYAEGPASIPVFSGSTFWVNESHQFALTETGTYSSSININVVIPNTGLTLFKVLKSDSSSAGAKQGIFIINKSLNVNAKYKSKYLYSDSSGTASAQIEKGEYNLYLEPRNAYGLGGTYSLYVGDTQTTLVDPSGNSVTKEGSYFPLVLKESTFKFRVSIPSDSSLAPYFDATLYKGIDAGEGQIGWINSDSGTAASVRLEDGSYQLHVNEGSTIPGYGVKTYQIIVSSGSAVIQSNGETVTPVSGIYNLQPGSGTISGTVLDPSGAEAIKFSRVDIYRENQTYPFQSQTTDVSGKFYFDLGYPATNGKYRLVAHPQIGVNSLQGVSDSVTVTVANGAGPSNVQIRLRTANISGVVAGPTGLVSPENWLSVSESKTTYSNKPNIEGPLTDKDGAYSMYLGTGKYEITPSSDYQNARGVQGAPSVCTVGANPATAVTCNVKLETPTVTGTVTIGGAKPLSVIVGLAASMTVDTNTAAVIENGTYWSDWGNENVYGLKVPAGTYRTWITYILYTGQEVSVPGPLCTVPATGSVICDIALPAPNLKIELQDFNGQIFRNYVRVSVSRREGSKYFWTCCSVPNNNSNDMLTILNNSGTLDLPLVDGSYQITIMPDDNALGFTTSYFVDVVSGTASNVRTSYETTTTLAASSGIFRLKTNKPLISGVIYEPDGVTPAIGTCYLLTNSNGDEAYYDCANNRKGLFAIGGKVSAGTYTLSTSIRSSVDRGDATPQTVVIDSSFTPVTVNLRLNEPNVKGISSGPLGVSKYSYIYVEKLISANNYRRVSAHSTTDDLGRYGFFLEAGTYRITDNNPNYGATGGVRGSSNSCVVSSDTAVVTTCNISLPVPNVTGKISITSRSTTNSSVLFAPYYPETGTAGTTYYGWFGASSGKYGLTAQPGTYRTYVNYYNDVKGEWLEQIPGQICIVPASGNVSCDISVPADNLKLEVKTYSGNYSASAVGISLSVQNSYFDKVWDQFGSYSITGQEQFSFPLVDGNYELNIAPVKGTDGGRLTTRFSVVNGAITNMRSLDGATTYSATNGLFTFTTQKPNLIGTATGPRGAITNTYLEIQKLVDGKLQWMGKGFATDDLGKYAVTLDPGTYQLMVYADFATTGASQTFIKCVIPDTSTVVTCDATLGAPNLTGTVKLNGTAISEGAILLEPDWSLSANTAKNSYGWLNFSSTGLYGVNAAGGSYKASLISYPGGKGWNLQPLGPCVVPETGTATCNFNLPSPNFKLQIKSKSGNILTNAFAHVTRKYGETYEGPCCSNVNYTQSTQIDYALLDGTYQLRIWSGSNTDGAQQSFTFTVETGTVTNLKASNSATVINASSGVYQLQLSPPAFSGQVFLPNGSTPAENVQVRVIGSTISSWVSTDASGKFSVDFGGKVADGEFRIQAFANRDFNPSKTSVDIRFANSLVQIETLTSGAGSQNIRIVLQAPNLLGRVYGNKGPLKFNEVSVQLLDSLGNWFWPNISFGTDIDGKYAGFLPAGTYRLFANGDMKNAGGGDTFGPSFTINTDSPTVLTSNLELTPPNASGEIKINGVAVTNGWLGFYRDYSLDNNTASWYSTAIYNGGWGITAQPGTYLMFAYDYSGISGQIYAGRCVVPSTGSVTCNAAIPASNLIFKVKDASGVFVEQGVYASIDVLETSTAGYKYAQGICCTEPDRVALDGKIKMSLLSGYFRVRINPGNSSISGTAQSYIVKVESNTVKSVMREIDSVYIDSQTDLSYIFQLQTPAITGTLYKPDNTTVAVNVRVCATNATGRYVYWRQCARTNSAGKFAFDNNGLSNGVWKVQALPESYDGNPDLTIGTSAVDTLSVTNNVGSKVLRLVLRTPNVTGVVSGPLGVSSGNYINVRKYYDDGSNDYLDGIYMRTDSSGRFAFALDPGKYRFQAQDDMSRAGGTSAMSSDCVITAGSSSTCNISLIAPNLSGVLKIGGVVNQGSIEFIRQSVTSFDYLGYYSGTSQSGAYWVNLPAGTYRTRIYLYNLGKYVVGPSCVVPASGSVTCNIDIPSPNFKFKVTNSSGTVTTNYVVTSFLKYSVTELYAGQKYGPSSSEIITNNSYVDGIYRLVVEPDYDNRAQGSMQQYILEISGGAVVSLKRDGTTSNISAVDGIFTLQMGVPSISGSVVAPDSVTAVPYADVYAFLNPYNYSGTSTDKVGAFAFNKLPDGTYSVIAYPSYGDATKAQSLPKTVTVSNGSGTTNLSLQLRTPNVTGVLSGPLGVSKFNWVTPEIRDPKGYWTTPDYTRGTATSAEGNFSFYLEPGTYRFRTQSDVENAGGMATISNTCVVPSSGSVTCNISMSSPNVKFRIVEPGQTSYAQGSYAWTYLNTAQDWSAIKNYNPQISSSNDGNLQGYFEDGTWSISVNPGSTSTYAQTTYLVTVSGGVVTQVQNELKETITATAGVYFLPLKSSNVTGTISANGSTFYGGVSLSAQRLDGKYYNWAASKWVDNGTFGFNLPAGTYRFEARPYWSRDGLNVAVTRSGLCEIPTTGTVTCNLTLKAPNLSGLIVDDSSTAFRWADASIAIVNTDNSETWDQWLDRTDGYFKTYLPDGKYRIQINPYWDYRATYTERSYTITVLNDSVTSIVDMTTGDTITAVDGLYKLRMGTPSVKGKVLIPGTGSTGATNVDIRISPVSQPTSWKYGTNVDASGAFSLLLPNGTYVIQAFPYGSGFLYGKSETQTITVTNGALVGGPITLRLRDANVYGRVVTPQGAPLSNVNVNIWVDGEYFYGWTSDDGRFGAYVDKALPNCPQNCSISLNYWASSDYTPKSYQISAKGNLGDLAIGGISTRLTVLVPIDGGRTAPSTYGYVSVLRIVGSSKYWYTSGYTNQEGKLGLALTQGDKYEITVNPGKAYVGTFAAKTLTVNSFDTATMATLSITFPSPNLKVVVTGSDTSKNAQGWYTISSWDSATSTKVELSGGYLNDDGKAALTLADGSYKVRFWPGRSKGVQKELTVSVTSGTVTISEGLTGSDTYTDGVATFKLPSGNISGTVKDNAGTGVAKAVVAAYRSDDATKIVTTVADDNGYYEINLDLTYSWVVKSLNPANSAVGQVSIASRSPSNSALSSQDITVVVPAS